MSQTIKQLQERISSLEVSVAKMSHQEPMVRETRAKQMITALLKESKNRGISAFDAIDIRSALNLPFVQITKIMTSLEQEGLVHESD